MRDFSDDLEPTLRRATRRGRAATCDRRAAGPPAPARDRGVAARPVGRPGARPARSPASWPRSSTTSSCTTRSTQQRRRRRDARRAGPRGGRRVARSPRSSATLAGAGARARRARAAVAVHRRARRARRALHDVSRARAAPTRRTGPRCSPHVPALGRAPRLRRRGRGLDAGLRGRALVGRVHGEGPLRVRLAAGRARRAPAGAHEPVQRAGQAPDRVRRARRSCRSCTRATCDIEIDEADIEMQVYRSSGAGGQHVNMTDSAVRLTHLPTGIVVSCQNERSQHQNKDRAMQMLKAQLADLERQKREDELAAIQGEQQRVGLRQPDPQLRAAAVPDGEGPPHRARDRQRRRRARRRPRPVHGGLPALAAGRRQLGELSARSGSAVTPVRRVALVTSWPEACGRPDRCGRDVPLRDSPPYPSPPP